MRTCAVRVAAQGLELRQRKCGGPDPRPQARVRDQQRQVRMAQELVLGVVAAGPFAAAVALCHLGVDPLADAEDSEEVRVGGVAGDEVEGVALAEGFEEVGFGYGDPVERAGGLKRIFGEDGVVGG